MRLVHCKREEYTHYIGRPGPYGNPFTVGQHGNRAEVIEKFENYARSNPQLLELIKQLPEDAILGCWCYPSPCHGEAIIEIWEELHDQH